MILLKMGKLALVGLLLICATGISAKRMRLLKCTRTLHSYPSMSKLHSTTVICPAHCPLKCRVYGTNVYAAYSSICCAGIHAGAINNTIRGLMTVKINPLGGVDYAGSVRNGVTSRDLERCYADFTVIGEGQTLSTTVNNEPVPKSTTTTTQTTTPTTTISTTPTATTTTAATTTSTTTTTTMPTSTHQTPNTKSMKKPTVNHVTNDQTGIYVVIGVVGVLFIFIVIIVAVKLCKRMTTPNEEDDNQQNEEGSLLSTNNSEPDLNLRRRIPTISTSSQSSSSSQSSITLST